MFLLLSQISFAQTNSNAFVGARASLFSAQSLLSTPPLPTLESGSKAITQMQAGYFSAKPKDSETYTGYKGSISGGSIGLGYTGKNKERLAFFALFSYGQASGDLETPNTTSGPGANLKDIQTQTTIMALGASYRLNGAENAPAALGVFAAPVIINLKTSSTVTTGPVTSDYDANPFIYGALLGVQFKLRLEEALILPYAMYMVEVSDRCKTYTSGSSAVVTIGNGTCQNPNEADLPASFSAIGIKIGYGSLSFNVYTQMNNDSSMDFIDGQQYQASLTLGLH